jgi:hypothetical protein
MSFSRTVKGTHVMSVFADLVLAISGCENRFFGAVDCSYRVP